jgi:hypothetical protein
MGIGGMNAPSSNDNNDMIKIQNDKLIVGTGGVS